MTLTTRKPTGKVPYPVLLVEGDEKSGKTWNAALLSASKKVGQTYWLDLGEGSADEYGAIPGTNYLVIEHDGSYAQILQAIEDVRDVARQAHTDGQPPTVLVIDSMSALWDGLKDWTTQRAVARARKRGRSTNDEDIRITTDLWNDAGARYRKVMTRLLTFPGIVVLTARGKEVAVMGPAGQPVEGKKEHKVEGHKSLAYDCSVWLRLSRTAPPLVVGARSVHAGIIPGKHDPQVVEGDHDNLLEWLIFDALRVDSTAEVRDIKDVTGGELTEDEQAAEDGKASVPREPRGQAQRARGNPAEQTAWTEPVAQPPVTTDLAWLKMWEGLVGKAESKEDWQAAWHELTAQVKQGGISPHDAEDCKRLWTEALKEQTDANAIREQREAS